MNGLTMTASSLPRWDVGDEPHAIELLKLEGQFAERKLD
jgi:hypothetical protein